MAGSDLHADLWIYEYISPWDYYAHGIKQIVVHKKTAFQELAIVETGLHGRALVLDGKWQSCEADEFLYHEPLVHPAMLQHGAPRRVLILGGGEGATAREVLRWKTVEHCTMVDIDEEVVQACREHLVSMHQNVFDDPRLETVIDDALKFLDRSRADWDVVISDLSDPIEHGPSYKLFTREYFQQARRVLRPGGVFVLQAGPVGPTDMGMHARLARTLRDVYAHVQSYASFVPTYAAPWGFLLACDRPIDNRPDPQRIDRQLAEKTTGGLRMFDGTTLLGMFLIPAHLRRAIAEETRVYTLSEPPRFFGHGQAPEPDATP